MYFLSAFSIYLIHTSVYILHWLNIWYNYVFAVVTLAILYLALVSAAIWRRITASNKKLNLIRVWCAVCDVWRPRVQARVRDACSSSCTVRCSDDGWSRLWCLGVMSNGLMCNCARVFFVKIPSSQAQYAVVTPHRALCIVAARARTESIVRWPLPRPGPRHQRASHPSISALWWAAHRALRQDVVLRNAEWEKVWLFVKDIQ